MSTAFLSLQQDIERCLKDNNYDLGDFTYFAKDPDFYQKVGIKVILVEDLTQVSYDSYGYEDTYLGLVFEFPEYDNILVLFEGKRSSFVGEEWYSYKEVEKKTKTISYYG